MLQQTCFQEGELKLTNDCGQGLGSIIQNPDRWTLTVKSICNMMSKIKKIEKENNAADQVK